MRASRKIRANLPEVPLMIALLILLLVAAGLRLGWPGLTEFKADEARLLTLALEMAADGRFPIRGIGSSIGVPNFPMSVWLYGLPLFVWRHVYAATLFTGLLNSLAVAGSFWLVRRYWGTQAALATALLFAVSPWALHHSRKIWAQNLLPFFVVGWGISGILALVESRSKFLILHMLSLAIAIQTHLAGLALIPATLLWLLLFWRRIGWRWLAWGVGLALLTAVPFIYYVATAGGDMTAVLQSAAGSGRGWDVTALSHAWRLSSGWEIHALAGTEAYREYLATVPNATAVHWLWGLLMAGGIGWLVWQIKQYWAQSDPAAEAGLLVLIWAIIPILFFTWPRLPSELHYLLPIYPTPYIIAGVMFSLLARRWSAASWIVLGGTAAIQIWVWVGLLLFVSGQTTPGGVGTPVAMQLEAVETAVTQLNETAAAEILIAGSGQSPDDSEFAAVYDVLLRNVPHRFVDVGSTAVFPAQKAIVLLDPAAGAAANLYQTAATDSSEIPFRAGESGLAVLTLPGDAAPAPQTVLAAPQILTNWAALAGYDAPTLQPDGSAIWCVYWHTGEASPQEYHLFNHFLSAADGRLSQIDAPTFATPQWRPGDMVVTCFQMEWPETAVTWRVGMYSYPDLEPVLLFDVAGNPYSDALTIPLPPQE